jgi:hypothetical protein
LILIHHFQILIVHKVHPVKYHMLLRMSMESYELEDIRKEIE